MLLLAVHQSCFKSVLKTLFYCSCALIELYNEGQPPFTLSQLLSYRINEYDPKKHLEKIEDEGIRTLLAHMVKF